MEKETFNAPEAEIVRYDEEELMTDFNIGVSGTTTPGDSE